MAELEIHHEHEEHTKDPVGRTVGILAAVISVFLAIVTIASHRAHTEGVLLKTEANDKWSYYQSKRIKFHELELGEDLFRVIGPKTPETADVLVRYGKDKVRYQKEAKETMDETREIERRSGIVEERALRFDFGEGLLEIGLVLSSLYFISKKTFFPILGVTSALIGVVLGILGFLLR